MTRRPWQSLKCSSKKWYKSVRAVQPKGIQMKPALSEVRDISALQDPSTTGGWIWRQTRSTRLWEVPILRCQGAAVVSLPFFPIGKYRTGLDFLPVCLLKLPPTFTQSLCTECQLISHGYRNSPDCSPAEHPRGWQAPLPTLIFRERKRPTQMEDK